MLSSEGDRQTGRQPQRALVERRGLPPLPKRLQCWMGQKDNDKRKQARVIQGQGQGTLLR